MSTDTIGSHPTFICPDPTAGDRPDGPCRPVGPMTVGRPWAGLPTTVNNLFTVISHK